MAKISKITPLGSSTTYDIAAWSLKQQGRLTDANITHETDGSMVHFKASSSMTANKPMGDGNILHFHWDGNASNSWDAQLYIPDSHGSALQWRAHTNATTWGAGWHTVLDDQNYSTTCDTRYVKKAGDTMTGTLTVPKINLSRNTGASYGRLQWYKDTYKTWTNYMSDAASGTCPSGGTPSTLGNVTTWAIRSYIENGSGYGWLWESAAESNTGTPTARMALSAYDGTLEVAGLVKITKNSNTTTIGSQNANFCHIYNSANIPFIFNNTVATTTGNLGTTSYPWNNLYMGPSNGAGIYYKGTKNTYRMIRFIDNTSDTYGNGISIGGGGQTIIGGGESADTAAAQAGTAGGEIMQVCNDGDVQIIANLQDGWNNRKISTFNTTGNLTLPAKLVCANVGNTTGGSYTESGLEIREYNYGSTQSDTWGIAPRMTFHWGGRVQAQIGLASNSWLYTTSGYGGDLTTNAHRFVIESGGTWNISISGNAATATKATQDQNGYNLNDNYRKEFVSAMDLSSLNVNTWYPVVAILPASGFRRLSCVVHLNSGTVPSWSTHSSGFTAVVELLATAGGWGTTSARTILLQNNQGFISDTSKPPVGYTQFTNSSRACFYLRGGGKYFLKTDWIASWGIITSSTTYSSQTIAPVTTYPNFSGLSATLVDMNGYSSFTRAYGAVWNDYAEYRKDNPSEIQEPGRCVRELGNGVLALTTKRLERGCEIISDTFGFAIGQDEENGYNTPIASNGRVLAYIYEGREYASTHIGWPVCSGPNGTVSVMTDEEYQKYGYCAVGTISEIPDYEEWGTGNVKVNGRVWIRIR